MSGLKNYALPAVWMVVIFIFSTTSFGSEGSGAFFVPLFKLFFPHASSDTVDFSHFLFRKACHLTEYAVLATFWHYALTTGAGLRFKKALILALVFSAIYAGTDEIHQAFVANRTASFADVLVDVSGAAIALLILNFQNKKAQGKPCA